MRPSLGLQTPTTIGSVSADQLTKRGNGSRSSPRLALANKTGRTQLPGLAYGAGGAGSMGVGLTRYNDRTMRAIYLDHNATTPLCPEAAAAMAECHANGWANPSSQHAPGRRARRLLEDAR